MSKKILTTILITLVTIALHAAPADSVHEYTLENGMKVFLLEDPSDALVHIEYDCRGGFSSQTQQTNGYFKLFSRLIKSANPELNFSDIQCNSDSTRYILEAAPQMVNESLANLADAVFSPAFTDEIFLSELTKLKKEVSDNADELSVLINAAIDSRVFSDAPWKHDSGIYPPLFKRTSSAAARNIIKEISDKWYIPSSSAIFISGNFNSENVLVTLRSTFGRFNSNYQTPIEKPSSPVNRQRKYVFNHSEISGELTQIVVQYTMLNMEQADFLAATLNNDASNFKQQLLDLPELNIPGAEYINVSSAHKKNTSRLIIQALMQPPENKKLGITSIQQADMFMDEVKRIPQLIDDAEVQFGKYQLLSEITDLSSKPLSLMTSLASFWALEPFYKENEADSELYPESKLTSLMMSRIQKISDFEVLPAIETLESEEPFVFVIINSKDFAKNKKTYKSENYEEINENNSSWYVQTMFKEMRDQFKPSVQNYGVSGNSSDNSYYQKNISQIQTKRLENGITVISKQNTNSTGVSMVLSIKGGKLNSASSNGFEEVMTNLLAGLIQREITKKQYEGLITGKPAVSSQTNLATSTILIDFDMIDAQAVCDAIANAIIYGEVAPASADRAVSSRQYKKRLENGSSVNQMFSAAVNQIYGKHDFYKIFETKNDILQTTDYTSILEAYPAFLDSSRYSLILTGNFDDTIFPAIESSFSLFTNNGQIIKSSSDKENIPSGKKITVKITHTFLTDIPAEKAGPQPEVLIPTTEFLDPVLYITKAPASGSKEVAIFNAILNQMGIELQKAVNSSRKFDNSTVTVQLPQSHMNFGTVYIQNVTHMKEADAIYRRTILDMENKLKDGASAEKLINQIKNNWTLQQMNDTFTNSGTALLLQKGLELQPEAEEPQADYYLKEYNYIQTAGVQDFIDVMELFPSLGNLRVYSLDGKE